MTDQLTTPTATAAGATDGTAQPEQPGLSSISHTAEALYRLLLADLKLSASGLSHALIYAALAIVSVAFVGLFGSALVILTLHAAGWSWLGAVALTTAASVLTVLWFYWLSRRALRLTGLSASQRQINAMIAAMGKE